MVEAPPTAPATAATGATTPVVATAARSSSESPALSTASAGTTTLVVDSSASKASYHAQEQLVGHDLQSEAVGTSNAVSGSIILAADGSIVAQQSEISVDLRHLKSDESRRDNFIQGNTLQTSRYPVAVFVPKETSGLPSPLPTSGAVAFQLSGDLTVHGVTRPVMWQVNAQFEEASVSGAATTQLNITDFGMTPPKAGPVLSIRDGITLELDFQVLRRA